MKRLTDLQFEIDQEDSKQEDYDKRIKFSPGSPEAVLIGCRCGVSENNGGYGNQFGKGIYDWNTNCKVHEEQTMDKWLA